MNGFDIDYETAFNLERFDNRDNINDSFFFKIPYYNPHPDQCGPEKLQPYQ